jgi:hypothetical protein
VLPSNRDQSRAHPVGNIVSCSVCPEALARWQGYQHSCGFTHTTHQLSFLNKTLLRHSSPSRGLQKPFLSYNYVLFLCRPFPAWTLTRIHFSSNLFVNLTTWFMELGGSMSNWQDRSNNSNRELNKSHISHWHLFLLKLL